MPLYSYTCNDCSNTTELLCPFSEKAEHEKNLVCNYCKSKNIFQQFKINIVSGDSSSSGIPNQGGCCGGSCGCH